MSIGPAEPAAYPTEVTIPIAILIIGPDAALIAARILADDALGKAYSIVWAVLVRHTLIITTGRHVAAHFVEGRRRVIGHILGADVHVLAIFSPIELGIAVI